MGKPLLTEEPAQVPREAGPQLGGPYLLLHQGLLLSQAGAPHEKGGLPPCPRKRPPAKDEEGEAGVKLRSRRSQLTTNRKDNGDRQPHQPAACEVL